MGCQHTRAINNGCISMLAMLMLGMTPAQTFAQTVTPEAPSVRVIGGQDVASVHTYPWMGLLQVRKTTADQTSQLLCGASFINSGWVLTAAHCVADKTWLAGASDVSVFAGQVDKDRFTPADEHPAAQVYVHRDYNPDSQLNDIALIRLSVSYTGGTLALANEAQSQHALVTPQGLRILGWGKTSNSETQGSTVLQTALLNPIDAQDCQTAWPGLPDSAFCAKGDEVSAGSGQYVDSCFGDSGGPLISETGSSVQVGIVSFGTQNCGTNVPSVYTRITSYLSWISGIQDGSITEVYAPSGGSGGGTVTPPTTDNCQIGGGIECGPGEGGGSFPLWIALFLPLIYVLRRRKHA